MLQPKTNILADDSKVIEALKRYKKGLILEYVKCFEFFIECFDQGASIWRKFI